MEQIEMLAPFGSKNPEPVLCARNIKVSSPFIVGNSHLKMWLKSNGMSCDSIWFGMGKYLPAINGANLDIVFTPQINNWNGSSDIQLKMKDVNIIP
jgi:single-stranded-DNA-specific exonuclease